VGWRIDYVLISQSLRPRLQQAFIRPHILGSDHCPVGIEIE
jgi:exodeoxyribonuclease-3